MLPLAKKPTATGQPLPRASKPEPPEHLRAAVQWLLGNFTSPNDAYASVYLRLLYYAGFNRQEADAVATLMRNHYTAWSQGIYITEPFGLTLEQIEALKEATPKLVEAYECGALSLIIYKAVKPWWRLD